MDNGNQNIINKERGAVETAPLYCHIEQDQYDHLVSIIWTLDAEVIPNAS